MIKSDLKKVRNLLDESVKYVVPEYQRNFTWKTEHAEEFFEDISIGNVFLGTIVLNTSEENKGVVHVVDGQQRITTFFIFLAACRYQAKKINSDGQAQEIQRKISFVDDTSGRASSSKLIPSPSIAEIFNITIASEEWDGKRFDLKKNMVRQANRIKPIYDLFSSKISRLDKDELAELLKKLYESVFIRIEVQDTKEAFDIFERTNARGMELNASDLLKNYLFANTNSKNLTEDWDDIVASSNGNILRLIKYFYVSKNGEVQKSVLFRALKNYGDAIGPDQLLLGITDFAYYYNLVSTGDLDDVIDWANQTNNDFFRKEYHAQELHRTLEALRLFGVTQVYPFLIKLLTVLNEFTEKDKIKASEKLLSFFVTIEKFHFINYAISQRPGNQIEGYYTDKCKAIINKMNFTETLKEVTNELSKDKLVGEAEFIEKFTGLTYGNDSSLIYYINDRLNNQNHKGGQYISIYNPDKKLLRKNFDIDHLVAQSANNYDFSKDDISECIDSIGNLLVISKHTNGKLQDKNLIEKLPVLESLESKLPEVNLLVKEWKELEWSDVKTVISNIQERARSLGRRAYLSCWKM